MHKKVYKRESVEEESQFVRYKFSDAFQLLVSSKRAMNVRKPKSLFAVQAIAGHS